MDYNLISRRLKPKFKKDRCIAIAFCVAMIALSVFLFYIGISEMETLTDIVMSIFLGGIFLYFLLCSPFMYRNIYVFISDDDVITVIHKDKEVIIDIIKTEDGKYDFTDPSKKYENVRYKDGSDISKREQNKIIDYLIDTLRTNGMFKDINISPKTVSNNDTKEVSLNNPVKKREQSEGNASDSKAAKIWLIALIICIVLTYLLFNFATTESQKALDNYDYSQIESYTGYIEDIEKHYSTTNGRLKAYYTEIVVLDNGEEIKISGGSSADYDKIGKRVRVYTNRYHNIWEYRERSVAAEETGEIVYYLPLAFTGTGIAMCAFNLLAALGRNKKNKKREE